MVVVVWFCDDVVGFFVEVVFVFDVVDDLFEYVFDCD